MVDLSRVMIATPMRGRPEASFVSYGYHCAVKSMERLGSISISSSIAFNADLVRARSRLVSLSLKRRHWDWILWFDDDVLINDVTIVERMIGASDGNGVIGAPYPRKNEEMTFPYRPITDDHGRMKVVDGVCEVESMAFGFMLTSRECLEKMVNHYREDEWFSDIIGTEREEVIGIFNLITTPTVTKCGHRYRELLGEDYSFCYRWRQMGGKVMMYLGPGSPLCHVGGYVYTSRNIGNNR